MTYKSELDPKRITLSMRDDIEALSSTADIIDVLVSEAEHALHKLQEHVEQHTTIKLDDWRIIKTFLRLASTQAEIVKNTSDEFYGSRMEAQA